MHQTPDITKPTRREGVLAVSVLFALLVCSFFPFVFGNKTMLESARGAASIMPSGAWAGKQAKVTFNKTRDPGAPAWESEPLLEVTRRAYVDEHNLPSWNSYQGYGVPLAANMQSQAYYPLTFALSLHHTPATQNIYILSRLFVAGICSFFYIRLFVSFLPALAAAVTSMFAGYFLLYISMPHLSVEVLLPAVLLASEQLVRNPRFRNMTWLAVLVFCVLSGGMPESSFLLLAYAYIYLLFRGLTDAALRAGWWNRAKWLFLATASGFGFAALLLVPFRQYMRYAFDTHQFANTGVVTGLIYDQSKKSAFAYLFPFLFGTGWDNNLRNFFGLLSVFLFVVAVLSISWIKRDNNRMLTLLTCFYGFAAVALIAKRYGSVLVNWTGTLPVFNLVLYVKYEEPLLSISVAMLCALGLERLLKWPISPLKQMLALGTAFLMIPLALQAARHAVTEQIRVNDVSAKIVTWSFVLPLALLVVVALLSILFNSQQILEKMGFKKARLAFSLCLLVLLTAESLFNYFVPSYYVWNSAATVSSNPFSGAPFVTELKKLAVHDRIFAENDVLMPNWASVFSLSDIRNLDAMYYRKYLPFVQQFFPNRPHQPGIDIYDRFVGEGSFPFDDPLEQRLLQMSSVKYVVTMPESPLRRTMVEDILQQNTGHLTPGHENQVSRQVISIGDQARISLGEHPPYERLPYHLKVDEGKRNLHFSYGINPAAFPICGDGAEFIVEARDPTGAVTKLYANYIDPRHDLKLRHWIEASVDLSRYLDRDVDVLLTTNGGPKNDFCADWAFWSDFYFDKLEESGPFHLVYKKEVNIYEYNHPLPRAAIYHNVSIKKTENEVFKSLSAPGLNPFDTVLLNEAALNTAQRDWLKSMNARPAKPADAGEIKKYESQKVEIEATLSQRGVLVLNDTDFPGWTAKVDGAASKIVAANYLFRGVLLEPGKHLVTFEYRPKSVQIGAGISFVSVASFTMFGLFRLRKRRRKTTA